MMISLDHLPVFVPLITTGPVELCGECGAPSPDHLVTCRHAAILLRWQR